MIDGDVRGVLLEWTRMCRRARLVPGVGIFAGCGITCVAAFTARDRRRRPLLEHVLRAVGAGPPVRALKPHPSVLCP
jgi:hypothetical protein